MAQKGQILFHQHYGMSNYELNVPVTSETKFDIASISKSYTAAAILILREKGLLQLDDTINRFLPEYPRSNEITIHQLLIHTSGLPRIIFFPEFDLLIKKKVSLKEAVAFFGEKPLDFEPGSRSGYSNANYVLLAYLVEIISGMDFREFLAKHIFDALNLNHTILDDGGNILLLNRALGYEVAGFDGIENTDYSNNSLFIGASGIYSTAEDLYHWMDALLNGRFLNDESRGLMIDPPDGDPLGVVHRRMLNRPIYSKEGWSNFGFSASFTHFPEDSLTIILLSNIEIITLKNELSERIAALVLEGEVESAGSEPVTPDPSLMQEMAGTYQFGEDFYNPGGKMIVVFRDGRLFEYQQNSGRFIGLIPVSKTEFIHRSSWGRVVFEQNEDAEILALRIYDRFRAVKVHP